MGHGDPRHDPGPGKGKRRPDAPDTDPAPPAPPAPNPPSPPAPPAPPAPPGPNAPSPKGPGGQPAPKQPAPPKPKPKPENTQISADQVVKKNDAPPRPSEVVSKWLRPNAAASGELVPSVTAGSKDALSSMDPRLGERELLNTKTGEIVDGRQVYDTSAQSFPDPTNEVEAAALIEELSKKPYQDLTKEEDAWLNNPAITPLLRARKQAKAAKQKAAKRATKKTAKEATKKTTKRSQKRTSTSADTRVINKAMARFGMSTYSVSEFIEELKKNDWLHLLTAREQEALANWASAYPADSTYIRTDAETKIEDEVFGDYARTEREANEFLEDLDYSARQRVGLDVEGHPAEMRPDDLVDHWIENRIKRLQDELDVGKVLDPLTTRRSDTEILREASDRLGVPFDPSLGVRAIDSLADELYDKLTLEERAAVNRLLNGDDSGFGGPRDGGDGGGGGDGTPPSDEAAEDEGGKPRSRAQKRIDKTVAEARRYLARGRFRLKGNKIVKDQRGRKTEVMSDEVNAEIIKSFVFFGIKITEADVKAGRGRWAIDRLFEGFQIYRGMCIARDGTLLGQDSDEVAISDEVFIDYLREIRNNTRTHGHPFAYTNPHYRFAGRQRYPVMPTRRLALFFTQNTTTKSHVTLTTADFMKYSAKMYNEFVEPRMKKVAQFDQRESLFDMLDAATGRRDFLIPGLGDIGIEQRSIDQRRTLSESLDPDSDIARLNNTQNELNDTERWRIDRRMRAVKRRDKKRRRGELDASKPMTTDEVADDPGEFWERATHPSIESVEKAAKTFSNTARVVGVAGLAPLGPTGVIEKGTGIAFQSVGLELLHGFYDLNAKPTDASYDRITEQDGTDAIQELLMLLEAQGSDGVKDAVARGVEFDKTGLRAERVGQMTKLGRGSQAAVDLVMAVTTGDIIGRKATAKIFLEYLTYALERDAQLGLQVKITPQDIEAGLESNMSDFLRRIMEEPQGIEALVYASRTSLQGVDPLTETLRKVTENAISDALIGFLVTWFGKFAITSAERMIPYSNTMIFAIKKGLINPVRLAAERQGMLEEGSTIDSNEFLLGGNGPAMRGLAQNAAVDSARFGYQLTVYLFIFSLMAAFGVKPPDDEDKWHLYYEWKIGDEAIKENWFWNEILGFAMPFAVAMHAGIITGDEHLAGKILTEGAFQKFKDNPWWNAVDLIDSVLLFDERLAEAQSRAQGYKGGPPSAWEFWKTQAMVHMSRRLASSIEPAAIRQFYNSHGTFTGQNDLARSPNVVFTPEIRDSKGNLLDPSDTTETTWADSQKRRVAFSSPTLALIMDAFAGNFVKNPAVQKTPYRRGAAPLVTISDPTNLMFYDMLSVKDAAGVEVPGDQWTERQKQDRVNMVIDFLEEARDENGQIDGSRLAANGVVIPYDARYYTYKYLYSWKNALRNDFEKKRADGEWSKVYTGDRNKDWLINQGKQQKAWNEMSAKQAKKQAMIDALFSDEIPYSARKYNRWETNYRDLNGELYASGDHKSSLLPWLTVDDRGEDTYDAQTPVAWQTDATNLAFVQKYAERYTIPEGINEGRNLWELLSGGGNAGMKEYRADDVDWDAEKMLTGSRALVPVDKTEPKLAKDDKEWTGDLGEKGKRVDWSKAEKPKMPYRRYSRGYSRGGWGRGGGGSSYTPAIYSHPAYSLNTDKPAGLYTKIPSYTRFDYLRPNVETKGSREAYRREDF